MVSITSAGTMKDNTDHDMDNNFGRSYPGNTTSTSIPDTKTTHDQHNGIMIALIVFSVILFLAIVCTAAKLYLKRRVKSNENIDRKNDAEVAIPLTTTNRSNGEMRKEASSEEEKLQPEVRCIVDSGFISNNSDGAQS
uniref:Uncharacterized protein n=1 Tax=Ciona savignyi TaxID=51511 RepID=H2YLN3_CIOSA